MVLRGTVITGGTRIDGGVVETRGDRIVRVGRDGSGASGTFLLPGLVDVHCHGGGGHGFPESGVEGVRKAVAHHLAHGTTTLLASLVSAPGENLLQRVRLLAGIDGLGGVHLEGPFLSAARCGAQDPSAIVPGGPVTAGHAARRRSRPDGDARSGDPPLHRTAGRSGRTRNRAQPRPTRTRPPR